MTTLEQINAAEAELQQAWAAGDREKAIGLRAQIERLWKRRRDELAKQAKTSGTADSAWGWRRGQERGAR
jgi:hypothetical protein